MKTKEMKVGQKVVSVYGEAFMGSGPAQPNEYIGRIAVINEFQCLIQLTDRFIGWDERHRDFSYYNLEKGYTYWWINSEGIKPMITTTMPTE